MPTLWAVEIMSLALGSKWKSHSSNVEEITLTYRPSWSTERPDEKYASPRAQMEQLVLHRQPHPHLRWRIRFVGARREERFIVLSDFIKQKMPRLQEMGLLAFETYKPDWSGGFA
ncbi:hypothetical protein FB451DRAFT_1373679 [Mycena latifolia]|nr:hypothetical protein FB451DRAFT_1373679 [Mycena latifolia]